MSDTEKKHSIENAINEARDGVGARIDELDRHLRENYDPKKLAHDYAPQLMAGGAVVGVLMGLGMPRLVRRLVTWGVPIAVVAMTIRQSRERTAAREEVTGLS
jgi:hypothetical protein